MLTDIFQPTHLLFILVVALLVLGPKRLPEVARQLGNGLRDFRSAINGEQNERHDELGSHESSYEPPQHSFEHAEPPVAAETHEFAHSESSSTDADAPTTNSGQASPAAGADEPVTSSGHEFAHESTDSATKPSDTSA